jgi:hypothetical protein
MPNSVGASLVEALDTFIADRRIEPQIAIKMLEHFDRIVAEVLNEKVKSRLTFKVSFWLAAVLDMDMDMDIDIDLVCLCVLIDFLGPPRYLPLLR